MNNDRDYWISTGQLITEKGPTFDFVIFGFLFQFQMSSTWTWVAVNRSGNLVTYYASAEKIQYRSGPTAYRLIFSKFLLIFGRIDQSE